MWAPACPTWPSNPKPGHGAAGNAAVGWLDGCRMVVARRPASGAWGMPVLQSGMQSVYYPALAMSAAVAGFAHPMRAIRIR
jgi:hypothetical protein